MLLWILRGLFLITMLGAATGTAWQITQEIPRPIEESFWFPLIPYAIFVGILLLGAGLIVMDLKTKNKRITTFSAVYIGLLIGLTLASLMTQSLKPIFEGKLSPPILSLIQLLLTLTFCYLCVSTLLQTQGDFRFIIPYVEFSKQVKGPRSLVLDTSVIIDGRIADICDARFIETKLIVPRFVLHELHNIADSGDRMRRNRGRRGIDVLKRLQNNPNIELEIHEANLKEVQECHEVDQQLVVLAKVLGARVMTNDFNLNKVAQLQGVEVINLNELANAMKAVALPGEMLNLKLVKPGDQLGQGVGYLEDGTMVVAEQGRSYIGQEVTLCVTSVLQTPAGRMIFGRVESRSSVAAPRETSESSK